MSDSDKIAQALYDISKSLRLLGNGNIAREDTSPGAIEGLAMLIRDSNTRIADALGDVADSVRSLAEAVHSLEK